ncbi:odorant-binding protein 2a-like [Arvicola amphibius]|uniref:odorant-binding protein 2a-like n=1 Tax=Arvicola amphibius TaxID=1047088 RepID=UPI001C08BD31|nr:odorant-binding protein 2a-like [Arvicola amphibius]
MKSLLLTFMFLGLVAVLKAQELPSDDQENYSGTWYPKAMIHNGSLPNHKIPSKVFPVKVAALDGGDLEADIIFWKNGQCHDVKILMKKTEEPGKFTSFHGKRSIYITELPVKDHYIIYCEDPNRGKLFGMGKLVGRNPEENPEAMEEFKKFVQRKGLKEENLLVPELKGENRTVHASPCVPYITATCLCPKPCLSVCFCVLSVPGLIVHYLLFDVCPCFLYLCGIFIISSGSQCHILSLCPSVSPCTSKSPVLLSTLSLVLSGSLVSVLQLQGSVSSPRVARPCLRSWLWEGVGRRCDGVLYRALLTPGLLLVSTEHCVPESE